MYSVNGSVQSSMFQMIFLLEAIFFITCHKQTCFLFVFFKHKEGIRFHQAQLMGFMFGLICLYGGELYIQRGKT